ncbi:unnamed protein product [Didymodactylos carnosus]|uniref:Uncharacterized protein n=1 Tax=Didymodactylos carnosus TaxID=1234261 RepID=A0A813X7R7_9BILA|nr:unnamed protein product [Didymodactylos carnosus]CAF1611749.1 unnamed protein product [Didymodactylos carnosus]CAF3653579.1 unnamed protein product [Didymodactylos carnosus]CAF4425575.1 unnamed protein product [Didymodactylos carnosus]
MQLPLIVLFLILNNVFGDKGQDFNIVQEAINQLSDEQKQQILQLLMGGGRAQSRQDISRQDNSNWCCTIDPGIEALSKTRMVQFYVQRHARTKCGYHDCGLFGWSSCTKWCDNYWSEAQWNVESYLVYQARLCPQTNLKCCAGYLTIVNHCFTFEEIMNNKEIFDQLVALGIPINALG